MQLNDNPLIAGIPLPSGAELVKYQEIAQAIIEARQQLGLEGQRLSDADIEVIAERAEEIFQAHTRAREMRQKAQQRLRQKRTLQRCLDAIVWDWDNPYVDPGDWVPLEE